MKIKKVMHIKKNIVQLYHESRQGDKLMLEIDYSRIEFAGVFGRYMKIFNESDKQIAIINVDDVEIKRID